MAEPVHLKLKANGSDIKGESTVTSLGRADTIECLAYEQAVHAPREMTTGVATGRRDYQPLRILKRIDKASPLIYKALRANHAIEAEFLFFRPSPKGDGTTEQFYTVKITKANIASVRDYVPNVNDAQASNQPPLEEVTFRFGNIKWVFTDGGIEDEDKWAENQ